MGTCLSAPLNNPNLPPEAHKVLVQHQTEPPGTYALLPAFTQRTHQRRSYLCANCHALLFSEQDRFSSGSGWPAFYRPTDANQVEVTWDLRCWEAGAFVGARRAARCKNCRGHLGHVFALAGGSNNQQHYCINAHALHVETACQ
ncbi:Mss4-like protein [Protomyces lactucae-debilis]|uniref:peptide-methionine (R)-S-oxide reductase n=1 Tax=Protomyces lactucae-debilis TaxID=2754530 RepID=A0A1Y2FQF0_PROLT|nr:Mss4-like protein [Protomyces lactucae-debilis]ORY86232.1 Mss4-like protein [Protomyces lactucae-debilis]